METRIADWSEDDRGYGPWERREIDVLDQNGNLILVRDQRTGQERWLSPHEIE